MRGAELGRASPGLIGGRRAARPCGLARIQVLIRILAQILAPLAGRARVELPTLRMAPLPCALRRAQRLRPPLRSGGCGGCCGSGGGGGGCRAGSDDDGAVLIPAVAEPPRLDALRRRYDSALDHDRHTASVRGAPLASARRAGEAAVLTAGCGAKPTAIWSDHSICFCLRASALWCLTSLLRVRVRVWAPALCQAHRAARRGGAFPCASMPQAGSPALARLHSLAASVVSFTSAAALSRSASRSAAWRRLSESRSSSSLGAGGAAPRAGLGGSDCKGERGGGSGKVRAARRRRGRAGRRERGRAGAPGAFGLGLRLPRHGGDFQVRYLCHSPTGRARGRAWARATPWGECDAAGPQASASASAPLELLPRVKQLL